MSAWQTLASIGRKRSAEPPTPQAAEIVAVDPLVLAAAGLHETPAGWRRRIEAMGLTPARTRGLPTTPALADVLGARRHAVWRQVWWRWFGGGAVLGALACGGLFASQGDWATAAFSGVYYGVFVGFLAFMVGRWRYDRNRRKVVDGQDPALGAVDAVLEPPWVDALKALALEPAASRSGSLVVDGTAPARTSLRAWRDHLQQARRDCDGWIAEASAGLQMVGALGELGGERAVEAGGELAVLRRRAELLTRQIDELVERIDQTEQDLAQLPPRLALEPSSQLQSRDLRPLYAQLALARAEARSLGESFARLGAAR